MRGFWAFCKLNRRNGGACRDCRLRSNPLNVIRCASSSRTRLTAVEVPAVYKRKQTLCPRWTVLRFSFRKKSQGGQPRALREREHAADATFLSACGGSRVLNCSSPLHAFNILPQHCLRGVQGRGFPWPPFFGAPFALAPFLTPPPCRIIPALRSSTHPKP